MKQTVTQDDFYEQRTKSINTFVGQCQNQQKMLQQLHGYHYHRLNYMHCQPMYYGILMTSHIRYHCLSPHHPSRGLSSTTTSLCLPPWNILQHLPQLLQDWCLTTISIRPPTSVPRRGNLTRDRWGWHASQSTLCTVTPVVWHSMHRVKPETTFWANTTPGGWDDCCSATHLLHLLSHLMLVKPLSTNWRCPLPVLVTHTVATRWHHYKVCIF